MANPREGTLGVALKHARRQNFSEFASLLSTSARRDSRVGFVPFGLLMRILRSRARRRSCATDRRGCQLRICCVSTVLCGLTLLLAPAQLAELLGVSPPALLAGVGAGLVLYAAGLFWTARQRPIPGPAAWAAIVLDLGWVLGSLAVVELGIVSSIGVGLVGLVAAAVLVFAILQFVGV